MVSELGDELGAVGFAIAAALVVVLLPVQVLLAVVQTLAVARTSAAPVAQLLAGPGRGWSVIWSIRCGS